MERKAITCPHSGHLADVAVEWTSLGVLVDECSALAPGEGCDRECARRMDRKDRLAAADTSERVLVVHAATPTAAEVLATELRADAFTVEIADARAPGLPPPEDYDAVVLVARRGLLGSPRGIDGYMRAHRAALRDRVTWVVLADELVPRSVAQAIADDMPALEQP